MNERKAVQTIASYLLPLFLAVLTYVRHDSHQLKEYGEWAIYLLTITLFIKPIAIIAPHKFLAKILSYRRELGIATVWLFIFHSFGMLFTGIVVLGDIFEYPPTFLFWGALAGMGLLIMGATSNNIAVRTLKRNWKRLHRIVYAVFFAALYHGMIASGETEKFYIIGGSYLVLKAAQIYVQNKKKTGFIPPSARSTNS